MNKKEYKPELKVALIYAVSMEDFLIKLILIMLVARTIVTNFQDSYAFIGAFAMGLLFLKHCLYKSITSSFLDEIYDLRKKAK